jgi:hypothetical protein
VLLPIAPSNEEAPLFARLAPTLRSLQLGPVGRNPELASGGDDYIDEWDAMSRLRYSVVTGPELAMVGQNCGARLEELSLCVSQVNFRVNV